MSAPESPSIAPQEIGVLVVDDDAFILKMLRHQLIELGFHRIVLCESGAAALSRLALSGQPIDLILCDLNMPQMDGIEFMRKLVDCDYRGSVVLVSGEDDRALRASEKLAGAHGMDVLGSLRKPVSVVQLRELLRSRRLSTRGPRVVRKTYDPHTIREALSRSEMINYYQPQVSVATGEVVGVETLVRWLHPEDGLILPDQFIGVAEEHGLIGLLTRTVTDAALAQAQWWASNGLPLRVAINVSMENLTSLDFVDFVADHTAAAAISPGNVILEVTESRLVQDLRTPLEVLTRLRLKRFRLSIDDFGTGHSSLAQLRDMPFDELKIDRSFVHGAATHATARAIYAASLGLAKQLGMDTVAEGVEDRADWDFLRSTGCSLAQGFFIGKPMLANALKDWTASWTERLARESLVSAGPAALA
ncbi:MAG: EAL domain-containing protein [Burkholderiaceae bacterium]